MGNYNINRINRKQDGAITVFLSLILVLVLSLIMTVIEGARQTAARICAERALTTAMDAVLAEFYGPLMEEYHVLGLDISYGNDDFDNSELACRIEDYISYTIYPQKNVGSETSEKSQKLLGITLEKVEVKEKVGLMDYEGSLLVHEATEYMKYKAPADVAEFFLKKTSLLEQPQKISILYEDKLKLEEEAVAIDEGILALMKYLDGVSTGKKGLLKDKGGKLKTEKYFVKKIFFETPDMKSTGINNNIIFLALQDQYVNPSGLFASIINNLDLLQTFLKKIEEEQTKEKIIQEQIKEAGSALSGLRKNLSELKEDDKAGRESLSEQISNLKDLISGLDDRAGEIRKTITDCIKEKNRCINKINAQSSEIEKLLSGCLSRAEKAISELEQVIAAAESIKPQITAYEDKIKKYEKELDKDIYESFENGLKELKNYLPENNNGYNFTGMKEILKSDLRILEECNACLKEGHDAFIGTDYVKAKGKYEKAYNRLLSYQTRGLNLDYSSLVVQKEDTPDFLESMKDLIKEGITGLVIDPKDISDKALSAGHLPSDQASLSGELQNFNFSDLLKKVKTGNKNTGLDKLFGSFDDYGIGSLLGDVLDKMAKGILLAEYIKEHFYEFTLDGNEMEKRKPSVLNYEREYLLFGKSTDKDNLEAVITKLVLIRTVLNFTSILADKSKWTEAKALASALIGFTGLPILVAITQSLLMILLALASGLVDTCALLMGKEIPVIKRRVDLSYTDLLLMTRDYIQRKAESYENEKGASYNDYITFFMYLTDQKKLAYRMMDMMQENIKLRYGTNFNFQNCIFGYEVQAGFSIKPLFTTFTFVREHLNSGYNSGLSVSAEYSY